MAQATSPSLPLSDGQNQSSSSSKSNSDLPIDPSIAAQSPTYPGPYSPYPPQGHDMNPQYPGHPPPGYPHWPGYGGHPHGMPYSSPSAPSAGGSPATTGPPRPGQVKFWALGRCIGGFCSYMTNRFILSSQFPAPNSISGLDVVTRKSSACINVVTMGAKRLMVHSITLMPT